MSRHNKIIALLFIILASAPSFSYIFSRLDSIIQIYPSGDVTFNMTFIPEDPLQHIEISFPVKLIAPEFVANGTCTYSYHSLGTLVTCNGNITRLGVYARTIGSVSKIADSEMFYLRFPVLNVYRNSSFVISLPEGYILSDDSSLEKFGYGVVEPSGYETSTDGRKIYVRWSINNPELGRPVEFRVIFRKAEEQKNMVWYAIAGFSAFAIAIIVFALSSGKKSFIHALDPDEKKVYELVSAGKIKQSKVVRKLDMSKAKVSRIVKRLEEKGLVKKTRLGRDNLLEVVK